MKYDHRDKLVGLKFLFIQNENNDTTILKLISSFIQLCTHRIKHQPNCYHHGG